MIYSFILLQVLASYITYLGQQFAGAVLFPFLQIGVMFADFQS